MSMSGGTRNSAWQLLLFGCVVVATSVLVCTILLDKHIIGNAAVGKPNQDHALQKQLVDHHKEVIKQLTILKSDKASSVAELPTAKPSESNKAMNNAPTITQNNAPKITQNIAPTISQSLEQAQEDCQNAHENLKKSNGFQAAQQALFQAAIPGSEHFPMLDVLLNDKMFVHQGPEGKGVVVDVGLNEGAISLYSMLHGFATLSFEAFPENLAKTKATLRKASGPMAKCYMPFNLAAWSHTGAVLHFDDNISNGQRNGQVSAGGKELDETKVVHPVVSVALDDLILPSQNIHLLKLDAEGSEWMIAQGATNVITQEPRPRLIMFEFSSANINGISGDADASLKLLELIDGAGYTMIIESAMGPFEQHVFERPMADGFKQIGESHNYKEYSKFVVPKNKFQEFCDYVASKGTGSGGRIADMLAFRNDVWEQMMSA